MLRTVSASILFLFFSIAGSTQSLQEIYKESILAYQNDDFTKFRDLNVKGLNIHPSQVTLLYNLAAAHSLLDQKDSSFMFINKILTWNANLEFKADNDFANLISDKELQNELNSTRKAHQKYVKSSTLVTALPENVHIEDVQKINNHLYFTDVLNGLVLRKNLMTSDIDTLLKVDGSALAIHSDGGDFLYVSSSYIRNGKCFQEDLEHQGRLYKIDLSNQQKGSKAKIDGKTIIGSIGIADDYIYLSNSLSPEIIVYDKNLKPVDRFEIQEGRNLQGLTLIPESNLAFLADYIMGIALLDLSSGKVLHWLKSNDYLLKGIDGINYIDSNALLIIQNSSSPKRVAKLTHDNGYVKDVQLLDNALKYKGEPTNGHLIEGEGFYYIANSQWPFYNKEGKARFEEWERQEIRRIDYHNIR